MNASRSMPMRALLLFAASVTSAPAHEGPAQVIERLTQRIEAEPPSARLLVDRAEEHRILGHTSKAVEDYQLVLAHDPTNVAALRGLARCELEAERFTETERLARRGAKIASSPEQAGAFYALIAVALEGQGDDTEAVSAWERALKSTRPEVDWLLAHADALRRLGESARARDALAAACERNPSAVLHRAWIAALIVCDDLERAGPAIEEGLRRARFKSTWLLLRSRLHTARGEVQRGRKDARRALEELRQRYTPGTENPILKSQIAEAEALLASS